MHAAGSGTQCVCAVRSYDGKVVQRKCMPSEVREVPVPNPDAVLSAVIMYLFITMPCIGNHEQYHGVLIVGKTETPSTSCKACQARWGQVHRTRGNGWGE